MRLNEMDFEKIKIGQRVKSLNTFVEGTITHKLLFQHDDEVWIEWDNGNESVMPSIWGNSVEILQD